MARLAVPVFFGRDLNLSMVNASIPKPLCGWFLAVIVFGKQAWCKERTKLLPKSHCISF